MTKESHSGQSQDARRKQGNNHHSVPDHVKPRVEDKGKEIKEENSHFTNRATKNGQ